MKRHKNKIQQGKYSRDTMVTGERKRRRNLKQRRRKRQRIRLFILIFILLILLFWAFLVYKKKGFHKETTPPPVKTLNMNLNNLKSNNAILIKLQSNKKYEVIAERNAQERIYPASLTKIMTAILAVENMHDLSQEMEVPNDVFQFLYEMNASVAGFEPGEVVSAEDLIYGVLLASGAECCLTLSDYIAGSEEAFVEQMNQKAKKLGMEETNFCNTTGLQNDNHYTTVGDLAVLLKYALNNPEFRKIFTSRSHIIEPTNIHPYGFTIQSTLFENMEDVTLRKGEILGGKTGYTQEAGLCLASLATVNGKEYILITAHADGSHETEQFHIKDAVNVYNQISQ